MNEKIKISEKLSYTSGNLAQVLINNTLSSYLLFFYTDILGVTASVASVIFLAARILNICLDPVIGTVSDRTRSKWGSYRPWVLIGGITVSILAAVCFQTPVLSENMKNIWAAITYISCIIAFSCAFTPYGVLNNVMTRDTVQRSTFATFKETGSDIAAMIIGATTLPLVTLIGKGSQAKGYSGVMIVYAIIAIIFIVICFMGTRERLKPSVEKVSLVESFKTLKGNVPAFIIMVGMFVMNCAVMFEFGWIMYYCKYFLEKEMLAATFFTLAPFVAFLCKFIIMPIIKALGKRKAMILGSVVYLLDGIIFIAAGKTLPLVYLAIILFGVGLTTYFTVIWGALPDIVEYGEYKSGLRAPGFLYSLGALFNKLGNGAGTMMAGLILTAIHYVPDTVQAPEVANAIKTAAGVPLIVAGIICIIVFQFYKLDTEEYNQIIKELDIRRADEKEEA